MAKKVAEIENISAFSTDDAMEVKKMQGKDRATRLVYVGPNIPGGILQRFQVFKGGFPPYCADVFEKVPEIKELFVPVEELASTRQKIEESGSNEARLFHIIQQAFLKGGK